MTDRAEWERNRLKDSSAYIDVPPPEHAEYPSEDPHDGELLLADAMMGVYNAITDGWSETEEFTIEQMPGSTNVYEIDLPATKQTIRLTVDLSLPRR